jgi:hypothetical protein
LIPALIQDTAAIGGFESTTRGQLTLRSKHDCAVGGLRATPLAFGGGETLSAPRRNS